MPVMPSRRFLALSAGRDYTTQPPRPCPEVADEPDLVERIREATSTRDEPEAASDAWVTSLADINRRLMSQQVIRDVAEAQQARPALTPQHRLDTVYQRAKHAHVDMSHPIHLVQKEIDKARLRGRPISPAAVTRLEGLEALLDGVSIKRLAA